MAPVRQYDRHILVLKSGLELQPPIDTQHKIAKGLVRPQALVPLGLAACVIVEDAVDDLPMAVVSFRYLPAGEVSAVEERCVAFRGLVGSGQPEAGCQDE